MTDASCPTTTPARGKRLNGHTKWVVGAFSAGILASVAFFALADRARLVDDTAKALATSTANDKGLALVQRDVEEIKGHMQRIEGQQGEILTILRAERED